MLNSLQGGYVANTGLEQLDALLSRGGIQSMMWTLSLALIALALGGILDRAGFVRVLMNGILSRIKRSASLMTATIGSGLVANMSMGEAYLSIIFGGQIFKASYEDQKLEETPVVSLPRRRRDTDYIVDPMDDIRRVLYGRSRPVTAGVRAVGVLQLHQSALVHSPRLYGFRNIPADRQRPLARFPFGDRIQYPGTVPRAFDMNSLNMARITSLNLPAASSS